MTRDELKTLIRSVLTDELRRYGLDDSELNRTATVDVTDQGDVTILLQDYATFVDRGRRPGRKPPVGAILDWIQSKSITPNPGQTRLSLAYAIATAIGKRGIRPRQFLTQVADRAEALQEAYIESLVDTALSILTK